MYEAVTPYPAGTSTVARYAATAASVGYDGLVVRTTDPGRTWTRVQEAYDIDIVPALQITADDPTVIAGQLSTHRNDIPLIMVEGGTPDVNRFAVEDPRVDVLTAPMQADGDINHVLANAATQNNVHIEYRFAPVLRSTGSPRVQAVSNLRKLREVLTDADAPYVVSTAPQSHLHLRSPRDLHALGALLGFEESTIREGFTEWCDIIATNRSRLTDTTIEPGVKLDDPSHSDGDDR